MRPLILLAATATMASAQAQPPLLGAVSGHVTCSDTGKPARWAEVQISPDAFNSASHKVSFRTRTFYNGDFEMEGVSPGTYTVTVELPGYVVTQQVRDLEQTQRSRPPASDHRENHVSVFAGVRSSLSISIERGSSVSGHVLFNDSSPAIGVTVVALRATTGNDPANLRETLGTCARATTDFTGLFVLCGLPVGDYTIKVSLPLDGEKEFTPVFLGDTTSYRSANIIRVPFNQMITGMDVVLPALSGGKDRN